MESGSGRFVSRIVVPAIVAAPPGIEAQVPISNAPETTGRAWRASVLNTEDQNTFFFVHAICVDVASD